MERQLDNFAERFRPLNLHHDVLAVPSRRNRTDLRNAPAQFHDLWSNPGFFNGRILMWRCLLNSEALTGWRSTAFTGEES
jgi:hypothetical protein